MILTKSAPMGIFQEIPNRALIMANFTERTIRFSDAVSAIGCTAKALRHWLQRGLVTLECEPEGREWRSFTPRDVLVLAIVHRLGSCGVGVRHAHFIADRIVPLAASPVLTGFSAVQNYNLIGWPSNDGGWDFRLDRPDEPREVPSEAYVTVQMSRLVDSVLKHLPGID